jgi:hypothetical protein
MPIQELDVHPRRRRLRISTGIAILELISEPLITKESTTSL